MVRLFRNQIICIWKNYHPSPNHNKGGKTGPKRPGWLEWGYKKAGWVRDNHTLTTESAVCSESELATSLENHLAALDFGLKNPPSL